MPINLPVTLLLFGSMLWGLTWIPLKYFDAQGIAGVSVVFIAYGAVSIALLPLFVKQYAIWKKQQDYIWLIMFLGGFGNLAFTTSLMYGDVVRVMVLFYLLPAWGVLGGRIFLKEQIDGKRWLAVGLALSGAFMVLGGFQIFETSASWVDFFALGSGFALAMNNIAFRATPKIPVASKISAMFVGGFIMSILFMILLREPFPQSSFENWAAVIAFGVFWILIATLSTQWAVTRLEVGRASIIIIMELLTAVVSAMWIGNETLNNWEMTGGLMIIIAAVIEARRGKASSIYKQPD